MEEKGKNKNLGQYYFVKIDEKDTCRKMRTFSIDYMYHLLNSDENNPSNINMKINEISINSVLNSRTLKLQELILISHTYC